MVKVGTLVLFLTLGRMLFNMLSRLVITFLPRSKRLLISWLQSPSAVIFDPPSIKSDTFSIVSPSISHEVMGPDAMIFIFWMFSFKPTFSLSSFTFIISWQIDVEKVETVTGFIFLGSKITVDSDCSHEIKRRLFLGRKAMTNLDSVIKKQRHHFANKGPYSQSYGFSSRHVWMWELDQKEGWGLKNWCLWIVVLEKIL